MAGAVDTISAWLRSPLQVLPVCRSLRRLLAYSPLGDWGKWVIASSKLVCYNSRAMPATLALSGEPISFIILDIPNYQPRIPVARTARQEEA
jgi:hypothetical protein